MILHARHQDHRTHPEYVIAKPYAIVGRNTSSDICLHQEDVSKQHAYMQVLDGRHFCIDQGSRHGIFYKEPHQLYGWMNPQQPIEIGPYSLPLQQPVGESTDSRQLRNTAPFYSRCTPQFNPTQAHLIINGKRRSELNHQLALIGSREHCNIILDTREISPIHASIVRTQDGKYWLVVPIGIKVRINHKRCVSIELHNGNAITVGNHTLSFLVNTGQPQSISITSSSIQLVAFDDAQPASAPATSAPSVIELETDTHRVLQQAVDRLSAPDVSLDDELQESHPGGFSLVPLAPATPASQSATSTKLVRTQTALTASESDSSQAISARGQDLPVLHGAQDSQLVNAFLDHMKLMQQEMMTQFMVNLQQKYMEQVREEMNHLSKFNQERLQLRQSSLTSSPEIPAVALKPTADAKETSVPPQSAKTPTRRASKEPDRFEVASTQPSHDWITIRIAILEGERQSRWEKMKSAMFGR